ncbi:hypothetical protein A2U01_0109823, partial [Trifolium medium]|nr:hypothetical protein [Trifolium medium]
KLDSILNSKMISESPPRPVEPPAIRFLIGSSTIYILAPNPTELDASRCVKKSHIGCEVI